MEIVWTGRACGIVTSHNHEYVIDLLAENGLGICSCWAYQRVKADIEREKRDGKFDPSSTKHLCPHLIYANHMLLMMFKVSLNSTFGDSDQSPFA